MFAAKGHLLVNKWHFFAARNNNTLWDSQKAGNPFIAGATLKLRIQLLLHCNRTTALKVYAAYERYYL